LTRKDMHNIRTKEKLAGPNEEEKLLQELEAILEDDTGSTIDLNINDDNCLEAMFVQTSAMKLLAERYCHVLEVDTTYNLNDRRMPL
ncbi:hypothetical protein LSAT2_018370, partial [Lamellibrachia satsuma]